MGHTNTTIIDGYAFKPYVLVVGDTHEPAYQIADALCNNIGVFDEMVRAQGDDAAGIASKYVHDVLQCAAVRSRYFGYTDTSTDISYYLRTVALKAAKVWREPKASVGVNICVGDGIVDTHTPAHTLAAALIRSLRSPADTARHGQSVSNALHKAAAAEHDVVRIVWCMAAYIRHEHIHNPQSIPSTNASYICETVATSAANTLCCAQTPAI